MKKKIAFREGNLVVTISLTDKSFNNHFEMGSSIYSLKVTSKNEMEQTFHDNIVDNLDYYAEELENKSINQIASESVKQVLRGYKDYHQDVLDKVVKDDALIDVSWVDGGDCRKEILRLFKGTDDDIKELISMWCRYQLETDVNPDVIKRVSLLMDRLDSGKDQWVLAEDIVQDYLNKH